MRTKAGQVDCSGAPHRPWKHQNGFVSSSTVLYTAAACRMAPIPCYIVSIMYTLGTVRGGMPCLWSPCPVARDLTAVLRSRSLSLSLRPIQPPNHPFIDLSKDIMGLERLLQRPPTGSYPMKRRRGRNSAGLLEGCQELPD